MISIDGNVCIYRLINLGILDVLGIQFDFCDVFFFLMKDFCDVADTKEGAFVACRHI